MQDENKNCIASLTPHPLDGKQCLALFSHSPSGIDTHPDSNFWSAASPVFADCDTYGQLVPGHTTEIRVRWTGCHLYFLFTCPYIELCLKPDPQRDSETNELWNWDVAEVFIGTGFTNIRKYKEFEISPQGEWVDLDIDLDREHPEEGWTWTSGCLAAARIDLSHKTWYGFIRVPYSAVDHRPAAPGNLLRVNFYRGQGPESNHCEIAWQPTHAATFHVPESFGLLKFVKP